ncbi:hypothetical protein J6590_040376 [Homalodisca vitripennis]|nr:hypothetical protein J6590_040376 [Homalodisca vitripennis]
MSCSKLQLVPIPYRNIPPDSKNIQSRNTSDGTFDTTSTLSFTATRFENGGSLTCEVTNDVMMSRSEAPMRDNIKVEVLYPPIVTVYPENITVNESMNITILCHYEANPSSLRVIKW